MPAGRRRRASAALLGAAATALSVKAVLATPLGAAAQPQIDQLKQNAAAIVPRLAAQPSSALGIGPATTPSAQIRPPSAATGAKLTPERRFTHAYVRKLLTAAAQRHNLDPKLVLAISYWESGWDQARISDAGARGLMQVQPDTASEAGPALLHRQVDLTDPYDNADVGAAIFRQYLDAFGDTRTALAAYNQGPTSIQQEGIYPETWVYVDGILSLAQRM